jgi:hypothetical protein
MSPSEEERRGEVATGTRNRTHEGFPPRDQVEEQQRRAEVVRLDWLVVWRAVGRAGEERLRLVDSDEKWVSAASANVSSTPRMNNDESNHVGWTSCSSGSRNRMQSEGYWTGKRRLGSCHSLALLRQRANHSVQHTHRDVLVPSHLCDLGEVRSLGYLPPVLELNALGESDRGQGIGIDGEELAEELGGEGGLVECGGAGGVAVR